MVPAVGLRCRAVIHRRGFLPVKIPETAFDVEIITLKGSVSQSGHGAVIDGVLRSHEVVGEGKIN